MSIERFRWAPAVAGLVGWMLLCAPVIRPDVQLGDRDTSRLYYPIKRFVADGLAHHELRFWDWQAEGGVSLAGQVTPGVLHPFTLLYVALPFDLAFKLNHLLALLLGGVGAYLLARRLGVSAWASLVAGVGYGGSGALVSAASSNLPYALGPASAPLAIAALLWVLESARPWRLLVASAALSLCAFAGDPQTVAIAIGIGVVWVTVLDRWRGLRIAAAWALCGALLAAPVALPGLEQLGRSERFAGVTPEEAVAFSVRPVRLLGLLVPRAFDSQETANGQTATTFSEYFSEKSSAAFLESILLGAPLLLLAACAGRLALVPLVLAGLLMLAATQAGSVLSYVIPGWRIFRYTEKLLIPASWLVCVAGAIGADRVFYAELPRLRKAALALLGLIVVGLIAVGVEQRTVPAPSFDPGASLLPQLLLLLRQGLLESAGFTAAVLIVQALCRRWPQTPGRALVALICAVSALVSPPLRVIDAWLLHDASNTGRKVRELVGDGPVRVWADADSQLLAPGAAVMEPRAARLLSAREALWPQLQALDGFEGVASYFSALDARALAAERGAPNAVLALMAVEAEVSRDADPRLPHSDSGFAIRRVARDPPRAFVVHRAEVIADLPRAVEALRSVDVHATAIVSASAGDLGVAGPDTAVFHQGSDAVSIDVDARSNGLLIVAERYDRGWTATVDGAPAPIVEADLLAMGIPAPAGKHRVDLRYRPVGLIAGLGISFGVMAVLVGLSFLRGRSRR